MQDMVVSTFQNKIIYNLRWRWHFRLLVVSTFQNKIIYNLCPVTDWNLVLYVFFHPFFLMFLVDSIRKNTIFCRKFSLFLAISNIFCEYCITKFLQILFLPNHEYTKPN